MPNTISDFVANAAGALAEELDDLGGERASAIICTETDTPVFLVAIARGGSAKRLRVALDKMDEEDDPVPGLLERALNWLVQGGHS